MAAIKGVLIDLSGTLHIDNAVTANAVHALKKLRQSGVSLRFVTNSTKTSDKRLHDKLTKLGFDVSKQEIFSSLGAAKTLIQQHNCRPFLLLEDEALEQFGDIDQREPHNAVVVGLAPSKLDYGNLNKAFRILLNDNSARLVGIHRARYYASSENELAMGPGGFISALEFAADTTSVLVGKPRKEFYQLALKDIGLDGSPELVAMIGDDVAADLGGGAVELGLKRILVRTGKYRQGDEDKAEAPPLYGVFDTFSDAVDHLVSREQ